MASPTKWYDRALWRFLMNAMSLSAKQVYSMDCKYPYMMYAHLIDRREHLNIDVFVFTLLSTLFKLKIAGDEGTKLLLYTLIPIKYVSEGRLNRTNHDVGDFNANTHENTSYKELARQVKTDHQDERNPQLTVIGSPQVFDLPFPCEDEVVFNVVYDRNRSLDEVLQNHRQFNAVLQVRLVSVVKPQEDVRGGFKILESEDNEDAIEEDDDDDEM